ncbi:MAG: radical SAM protein [Myxococcales bacterium]|nr:radical SAM protein [Myxococcales bacterium]
MAVTLLGHEPELHDRLAGRAGSFAAADAELATAEAVRVALRRGNVFAAGAITSLALARRGGTADIASLDPHPAASLAERFETHLALLERLGAPHGVRFEVDDPLLRPLLAQVSRLANPATEPDLLRLLGVICDTVLIGPHWFVFEVVNRCNARCRYCNIHSPGRRPGRKFLAEQLPFEVFARTVADLARLGTDGITILANGEPTLHPDFDAMVRTAKAHGLRVNFFTNGLLLDEARAAAVLDSGADEMFCTISAATPRTYAALHAAVDEADWQTLRDNLRSFFARRRAGGKNQPTAAMVNVICGPNVREILAMIDLAADWGFDAFRAQLLRIDDYNRDLALSADDLTRLRAQLPEIAERCRRRGLSLWEGLAFQLQQAGNRPDRWSGDVFVEKGCFIGWALGLAKSNGDLSFCCTVKPVARLADGPFADLWRGPAYQRARLAAKNLRGAGEVTLRDGSRLYDEACHHCDNHDINARLHELLERYDLWRFLG